MGGQACILYGAAEFSKDIDFVFLLDSENLSLWSDFVAEAQAEVIAVPPFDVGFLAKGHAVHFRAHAPGLEQLRIDIMSTLRGLPDFSELWSRRTTAELLPDLSVEVLSLQDLVQAKKTQRDKDWPMIRRLVDVDYIQSRKNADSKNALFWLTELRTPEFLIECASQWPAVAEKVSTSRFSVIEGALKASRSATQKALDQEENEIREDDRRYWQPLKKELESLRRDRNKK